MLNFELLRNDLMLRNARTNVLIHRRHAFNFLKLLNLVGLHYFTWEISCKSSSTAAKKWYERSMKRKVLADTHFSPNVLLKKKTIDEDTHDNTNGKFLKSSL